MSRAALISAVESRRNTTRSRGGLDAYDAGYNDGLDAAIEDIDELTPRDAEWQDEPTADGWHWLKCASERYGYIADAQAPVWIYKSRDNGLWYISDPDTVYDERLDGMQVAPCTGRPAE